MDRARTKAAIQALLAPQRQSRYVRGLNVFFIAAGLASAIGLGLVARDPQAVLIGCGLMLYGAGSLLRMWSGAAAMATSGAGMVVMLGGTMLGAKQWQFYLSAGVLIVLCALIPIMIWRLHRAMGEAGDPPDVFD
jgi:hypothetical protein